MKLSFDPTIRIAGIGIEPWARLGPERWFPQYKIASLYGWDVRASTGVPPVYSLDGTTLTGQLPKKSGELLQYPAFQSLLHEQFAGYDLLPYKAIGIPDSLKGFKFLMADESIRARYENKALFRAMFRDDVCFPEFRIVELIEMPQTKQGYMNILGGAGGIVLQDEQLGGGKGTFIIDSYDSYMNSLRDLKLVAEGSNVVVSRLIPGARERSMQACVTEYGVFAGPLQRQIVRNSALMNTEQTIKNAFCGIQIFASDQNTPMHKEAERVVQLVGARLRADGYRGIFGVDFLAGADNQLYTIELNPRITGATQLLTTLYAGTEHIPFLALHMLELGGYQYEIGDAEIRYEQDGALLVVYSLAEGPEKIVAIPTSGVYSFCEGELHKERDTIDGMALTSSDEWLLYSYAQQGKVVQQGSRLMTLQMRGMAIDKKEDILYNETVQIISALRALIKMEPTA